MKTSLHFLALLALAGTLMVAPLAANPVKAPAKAPAKTPQKPVAKTQTKPQPKATPSPTADWQTYRGAWFSVKYPKGWRAQSSHLPGEGGGFRDKTDAAYFTSPDKRAQFYVFSPQWNGSPTGAYVQPKIEVMVSRKQIVSGTPKNRVVSRLWTIRAKDKSYTRSVVDVENTTLNTHVTFSFRYKDARAYRDFAPIFARFKQTLWHYGN